MNYLTDEQVDLLQEVINDYRQKRVAGRGVVGGATTDKGNDFYMFYPNTWVPPISQNGSIVKAGQATAIVGVIGPDGTVEPVQYPDNSYWELPVFNASYKAIDPGRWLQGHLNKSGQWVLAPPTGLSFAIAPATGLPGRLGPSPGLGVCEELIPAPADGVLYSAGDLVRTERLLLVENWDLENVATEGDRLIQHDGRFVVGVLCDNDGDADDFKIMETS